MTILKSIYKFFFLFGSAIILFSCSNSKDGTPYIENSFGKVYGKDIVIHESEGSKGKRASELIYISQNGRMDTVVIEGVYYFSLCQQYICYIDQSNLKLINPSTKTIYEINTEADFLTTATIHEYANFVLIFGVRGAELIDIKNKKSLHTINIGESIDAITLSDSIIFYLFSSIDNIGYFHLGMQKVGDTTEKVFYIKKAEEYEDISNHIFRFEYGWGGMEIFDNVLFFMTNKNIYAFDIENEVVLDRYQRKNTGPVVLENRTNRYLLFDMIGEKVKYNFKQKRFIE